MERKSIGRKNKNYIDMNSIGFFFSILAIIFLIILFYFNLELVMLISAIALFLITTIPSGIITFKHIRYKKVIEYDQNGLYLYGFKMVFIPFDEIESIYPVFEVSKYNKKTYGKLKIKTKNNKIYKSCVVDSLNDITNELIKVINQYK